MGTQSQEPSVVRNIRIPVSLYTRIDELAKKRKWSFNAWVVNTLLREAQPKKDTETVQNVNPSPTEGK